MIVCPTWLPATSVTLARSRRALTCTGRHVAPSSYDASTTGIPSDGGATPSAYADYSVSHEEASRYAPR
jgi:hypothetical protein